MQLVASGPFPTGTLIWRSRRGPLALTVVSKATFTLAPGVSPVATAQVPLQERDEFAGHDPARWLRAPADLVPYKIRGDVVLVGQAYAPGARPVRALRVRLAAFGVDKSLDVLCDRRLTHDGRLLEGAPFVSMPLGWDRAAGGAQNPAGIAAVLAPDLYGTVPLPNVVAPDAALDRSAPAGLGPIAIWWPGRAEKPGRRGAGSLPTSWKDAAVPEDADDALFQVAPPDQQPARVDAGASIYLENLHPACAQLSTRLARVSLQATVERSGRAPEPLALAPDTIWFDTERGICTVTWRGCIGLARLDEAGAVRVWSAVAEAPGAPAHDPVSAGTHGPAMEPRQLAADAASPAGRGPATDVRPGAAADPAAPAARGGAMDARQTAAIDPGLVASLVRALPFEGGASPAAAPPAPAIAAAAPSAVVPPSFGLGGVPAPPASGAAAAPSAAASTGWDPRATAAVDPAVLTREKLPFHPAPEGTPPSFPVERSAAPAPRAYDPRETTTLDPDAAAAALAAFPFGQRERAASVPAPVAHEAGAADPPAWIAAEAVPAEDDASPHALEPAPFDVPPPPRIGPLAYLASDATEEEPPSTERPATGGDDGQEEGAPAAAAPAPPAWIGPEPEVTADEPTAEAADTGEDRRADLERRCRAHEPLDGLDLSGLALAGIELEGASLAGASLERADLSGAKLHGANLSRARLTGANLAGADLSGAMLSRAEGTGARMAGARLASAKLQEAELRDTDLTGADLTEARLDGATLDGSTLARVKAVGSTWERASLAGCAFVEADLRGTSFADAQCDRADFTKSDLGKARFRGARCDGATFDDVVAPGARLGEMTAPSASFRRAKLESAQLRGAVLKEATFEEAVLRRAVADGADLTGASLVRAEMGRASLRDAVLRGASLEDANLEAADLRGADLTQANATRARLAQTRLDGIKKDGAEGL